MGLAGMRRSFVRWMRSRLHWQGLTWFEVEPSQMVLKNVISGTGKNQDKHYFNPATIVLSPGFGSLIAVLFNRS